MSWVDSSENPQMGFAWPRTEGSPRAHEMSPEAETGPGAFGSLLPSPTAGPRPPTRGTMGDDLDEWLENRVSLVDDDGLRAMGVSAQAQGYLWVALAPPGPQFRGRLGLYIEESVEAELERLGALSPGIHASTGLDASLSDQLYRARLVEKRGIALTVPSLEGICTLGRILDAEDGAVLRWWIAAAADRPVQVVVSRKNCSLRVYPSPVLFESLFEVAPFPLSPRPPCVEMAESREAMQLSDLPPPVETLGDRADAPSTSDADGVETSVMGTTLGLVGEGDSVLEELWGSTELPELDAALGLSGQIPDLDVSETVEAGLGQPQLEGETPVMPSADVRAVHAEEVADEDCGSELSALAELAADVEVVADAAVVDPASLVETIIPPPPPESALLPRAPVGESPQGERAMDVDHLDPEEFLRTLAHDSSQAPEVTAGLQASLARPSSEPSPSPEREAAGEVLDARALTPLPTKKIRPFLRMATEEEVGRVAEDIGREATSPDLQPVAAAQPADEAPSAMPADDPFTRLAEREWRKWAKNLAQARGPKPLSVVERMFVTDYTRLREAVRRKIADPAAAEILEEWRDSFARSYTEAFEALRVRGKRPTMVLDLPEVAQRLARLQGARRVQLVLVDAMRFDLGLMIQERMKARVDAALAERLLLWSALPTTTTTQLELLGRGPEGLKEPLQADDEPPALVARGRAALTARRIRTGHLEIHKLDVIEDALRQPGAPVLSRFGEIAETTAEALCGHMEKLPPRTLVVVFGDHGFALDPAKESTTLEVQQGGASPEEVLVPAFGWLTGAVH